MASDEPTGWHHLPRPSNCLNVDNCDGSGSSSTNTVMSQALGISHQPPQCLNKSRVEPIRQKKKGAHCKISCVNDKKWPTTKRVPLPRIPGLNRGFLDSKMLPTGKKFVLGPLALRRRLSKFSLSWVPSQHTFDPRPSLQQSYIVV